MAQVARRTCRSFCFTDYEDLDWNEFWDKFQDKLRYVCVGQEICPKTKKRHGQGWMQWKKPKTWAWVKERMLSSALHIEMCTQTCKVNDDYCKKNDDGLGWTTWGDKFVEQGMRYELHQARDTLDNGGGMWALAQNNWREFCKYPRAMVMYNQMVQKRMSRGWRGKLKVKVILGPTGVGKTRMACKEAGDDAYVIHGAGMKWWPDYEGERDLIIDEYDNNVKIVRLLQICDGLTGNLEYKGGHIYPRWVNVWITSNLRELHENAKPAHRAALARRITETVNLWEKPELIRQDCINEMVDELFDSENEN